MFKDIRFRFALIVSLIIASAYLIWPTYKVYSLSESEQSDLGVTVMKELKKGSINLGLDLQGGMYVLLETDIPELVEKIANKILLSKPTISSIGPIGNLETINQIKNRLN